jgi:GT2 family glycosyltransferase
MDLGDSLAAAAPDRSASDDSAAAQRARDCMTVAVVVATTGRPNTCRRAVDRLARQTRPADRIVIVAVSPADVAGVDGAATKPEVHFAPRGLPSQRNHGVRVVSGKADLLMFFDDDFLPADDYIAQAERLFRDHPDVVGANGRMIADGATGPGLTFERAEAALATDRFDVGGQAPITPLRGLYGCNMVIRAAAIADMVFDEALPLYGWLEDVDFTLRLSARGKLVRYAAMAGVHMGEKVGRTSGRRLGYSQIANPLYLLGKGSIPRDLAFKLMCNNLAANAARSLAPEPYVDRRGRLAGNLTAIGDFLVGRLHPGRILDMG